MPDIRKILDQLGIDQTPLLFVQSSASWLERVGIKPSDVLIGLQERITSDGVIVMPSYPFSGLHEDFLATEPYVNLATTPAQTGMLPELLRRRPDSMRSLDPDLPLVAWGGGAARIAGDRPSDDDPTGKNSAFGRILDIGGYYLGLGVSHNYMALVHVLDSRYRNLYPYPIYSDRLYCAVSDDGKGNRYPVKKRAVLANVQKRIKPSRMIEELPECQDFFQSISLMRRCFSHGN
jgi:aminoglycoside N3'-acetyltransferase